MGRGKIEIKRIDNPSNRNVTYTKRRKGLVKKATEISILCDAKISLIIISNTGKIHEYCSPATTLNAIMKTYHDRSGKRLWDAKHESIHNEIERIKRETERMQVQLRHLKGDDITSLNYEELIKIEQALEDGLTNVRERQMEYVKEVRKNSTARTKVLAEENKGLRFILQEQEMAIHGINREMDMGIIRH